MSAHLAYCVCPEIGNSGVIKFCELLMFIQSGLPVSQIYLRFILEECKQTCYSFTFSLQKSRSETVAMGFAPSDSCLITFLPFLSARHFLW